MNLYTILMYLVPAPLTPSLQEFERQVLRILPWCKTFQIDIQDGKYVPSKTFTVDDLYVFFVTADQSKLAIFRTATFDFHLMEHDNTKSLQMLDRLKKFINIRFVFVHVNFHGNWNLEFENCKFSLCPTLSPEDPVKDTYFGLPISSFPAIQVMTIHPGPQGQAFIPGELNKIKTLRDYGFQGEIAIDGSVNEASVAHIMMLPPSYHPDMLCVGSYFSKAKDEEVEVRVARLLDSMSRNPKS